MRNLRYNAAMIVALLVALTFAALPPTARRNLYLTALLTAWGIAYVSLVFILGDPDDWGIFRELFFWPIVLILSPLFIVIGDLVHRKQLPAAFGVAFLTGLVALPITFVVTLVGIYLLPLLCAALVLVGVLFIRNLKTLYRPGNLHRR